MKACHSVASIAVSFVGALISISCVPSFEVSSLCETYASPAEIRLTRSNDVLITGSERRRTSCVHDPILHLMKTQMPYETLATRVQITRIAGCPSFSRPHDIQGVKIKGTSESQLRAVDITVDDVRCLLGDGS